MLGIGDTNIEKKMIATFKKQDSYSKKRNANRQLQLNVVGVKGRYETQLVHKKGNKNSFWRHQRRWLSHRT